jgi:hypothetical protein
MHSSAIRTQIESRTTEAFGKPIYPHLLRDIAVTELVDFAPDEIAIAPDPLGHADLRITQSTTSRRSGCRHMREFKRRSPPGVARRQPGTAPGRHVLDDSPRPCWFGCTCVRSPADLARISGPRRPTTKEGRARTQSLTWRPPGTDQRAARPFCFWPMPTVIDQLEVAEME